MAQTYLSGLSKGFISNMDNLKLINTCLHQDTHNQPASNTSPHNSGAATKPTAAKHTANKSFENLRPPKHLRQQGLLELQHPTKSFQTKKGGKNAGSTLSTSPKRASARDGSNSAGNNYSRKAAINHGSKKVGADGQGGSGAPGKKGGSISDLHLFIKAFEKDFSAQKGPATPKQILRKVEDQMRAYGLDPKSGNNQATAQALALKYAA